MNYHCEQHPAYRPGCMPCHKAKNAFWQAKINGTTQTASEATERSQIDVHREIDELLAATPPVARARNTDPETSHEAAALKDQSELWAQVLNYLETEGPGTEECILVGIGITQRSSASSIFAPMVRLGQIVNMVDPTQGKKLKLRNSSGKWAMVRGLPKHQSDPAVITSLMQQMESESRKKK